MNKVIVITGPTATGKTALSVRLAQEIGGEIVSADSIQIYKKLDIGSAKPSMEERSGIPHYLMDFVPADGVYSVADYVQDAKAKIDELHKKGILTDEAVEFILTSDEKEEPVE